MNNPIPENIAWDLQSVLVFAARYAYNRNTGASLPVIQTIIKNWENLDLYTQEQLIRESSSEAEFNKEHWSVLKNLKIKTS